MQSFSESKIDISQTPILNKLVQYLKLKKASDNMDAHVYDHAAIDKLIEKLPKGYCSGFTAVASHALWLQCQPEKMDMNGNPIPRDDWKWLKSILEYIAEWDEKSLPPPDTINDIERLLSLIEFFQKILEYLPMAQGEIHKSMEDTRKKKINREYSLAGLLTLKDLEIIIPKILYEDQAIFVSSHNHVTSLFLHDNNIIFYNSSHRTNIRFYTKNHIQQLTKDIFAAHAFQHVMPSPFGLIAFSFDSKTSLPYPSQSNILAKLPLSNRIDNYADNTTALFMAARFGCIESLKTHLRKSRPNDLNQANKKGLTPAYIAAHNGHIEVLRLLAENGADLNKANEDGQTPLSIAAHNGHTEALDFLIKKGANVTQRNNKGSTPAYMTAHNGHTEALRVLAKNHADLYVANNQGITPTYIAAQMGHVKALRILAGNRCGLVKISKNPTVFSEIESYLYNKDAVIWHNDKLYYADINKKEVIELTETLTNHENYHALKLACSCVYQEASCAQMNIINSLIDRAHRASPILDTPIKAGVTLLLKHAAQAGREEEVKNLFSKKDISNNQLDGFTPLHAAIFFGHAEAVKELIAMNFDMHRKTKENISGLEFSEAMNQVEIIKILQEAAARQNTHQESKTESPKNFNSSSHIQKSIFPSEPANKEQASNHTNKATKSSP